ncbi:MAG TPA: MBL fold metallo-hydrolase, partial [Thermoleophilaceae bacterium]|nr:MBL fold metallo-hydrolase [Thermoleophilaceae bacterium]
LIDALEWLGHSSFRLRAHGGDGGRAATIYIDPYRVTDGPPADLILITHGHYDHFSPRDVERLAQERTWLVAPAAVTERLGGRVMSISPGETIEPEGMRGVEVRAVAAYNTSKRDAEGRLFHPPDAGWVGYELNVWGERLYHAGDTDVIPEMDSVAGCDVALLPVSGTYVMTAAEAAEAARRIAAGIVVPMHWGEHIGERADAEQLARLAPAEVRILAPAGR